MIAALLPALVLILGDALKRLCPDAEARQKAEAELNAALLARARGKISGSRRRYHQDRSAIGTWARCLGWSAPGIGGAESLKVWGIVEIGLGGDDIGRSTKKTLLGIMEALNDERFYAATARQIADSDMAIAVAKIKEYQFIRGIVFDL
jgi:hypothetical protein